MDLEVELLCEKIGEEFDFNHDDIAIDLTIDGYISYIEINGKNYYKGKYKNSILESLISLKKTLRENNASLRIGYKSSGQRK